MPIEPHHAGPSLHSDADQIGLLIAPESSTRQPFYCEQKSPKKFRGSRAFLWDAHWSQ